MNNSQRSGANAPLLFYTWYFIITAYCLNVALRLIGLYEMSALPGFRCPSPAMDADFYYFMSGAAKAGSPMISGEPYYYHPFFFWFMRGITALFGENPYAPRIIGMLAGSTAPIAIFLTAREALRSNALAYIALALASFYGMFIFFDNHVLSTTYSITFISWGIYFLIRAIGEEGKEDSRKNYVISGVFMGLAVLVQANILLFIAIFALYFAIKKKLRQAVLFALPVVLIIAPITIRNYMASGRFVLITAIDGIHFYIGNNPNSKGIYNNLPGIRPNSFGHHFDAERIVKEEIRTKGLQETTSSRYYKRKALNFMRENPGLALRLFLKKLLISVNKYEVPNNDNSAFVIEKTFFLKWFTLSFWMVAPLGLAGLILFLFDRAKDPRMSVLALFALVYAVSVALFFVADRYRLPLVLPLFVFSAYIFGKAASADMKKKLLYAVMTVIAFFIVNLNLDLSQKTLLKSAEAKVSASEEICRVKDLLKTTQDPLWQGKLNMRLAKIYLKTGGWEQARQYMKTAFTLDPSNEEAELEYYRLGASGVRPVIPDE